MSEMLAKYFPLSQWLRGYQHIDLTNDLLAAVIVTIMLIPQSLAYALLAGLPAETGLYASMLPLILYALFGSSHSLAVGPVAVISLMTATAISRVSAHTSASPLEIAIALACLSGLILFMMGIFRMGFIANFLSLPVISGFITASAIIIAASQLKHILGIQADGENLPQLLLSIAEHCTQLNIWTLGIGVLSIAILVWVKRYFHLFLRGFGLSNQTALLWSRTGPLLAVIVSTVVVALFGLCDLGVKTIQNIPAGLPTLVLPSFDFSLWQHLFFSALLISLIGFVESVSVSQTIAAKRQQTINPDQELIGLGAANLGAALSGAFPITGGFARSFVNSDAGARTPAAGVFTALGIGLASLFLTGLLDLLPIATLAAVIIVAVYGLVDIKTISRTWRYSRVDFTAMFATIVMTLIFGVEVGIVAGVLLSILMYLYQTSRPHVAIIGQIPGTEHFRNCERHNVILSSTLLSIRVDESLYFANTRYLEDYVFNQIAKRTKITDVVLLCAAVNNIDASALESLKRINHRLHNAGIRLHLSEVKGPVMDKLQRTNFIDGLTGKIFMTQYQAALELAPEETDKLPRNTPIDTRR